jgi:hypothetical protein
VQSDEFDQPAENLLLSHLRASIVAHFKKSSKLLIYINSQNILEPIFRAQIHRYYLNEKVGINRLDKLMPLALMQISFISAVDR